ncbi:alginate lyase family protein [Bordetella muralis]|jgi:poly(beta-D-mannuronate) lyase|uniref:alginate lyase family protein n=1 Tax=Bordetella muralis TaxID=1649130 RepID=UPI0039EED531
MAPAAVKNIETRAVYVDKRGSIVDPERELANEKVRAPINKFIDDIQNVADDYYRKPSPEKLACGKSYLEKWAEEQALIGGNVSNQGKLVRFWAAGSIGVAVLKLGLDEKSLSPAVRDWLRALGNEIEDYINQREVKNNLYYWSGYALGVMGRVLHNADYQKKSLEIFNFALSSIEPDGTLSFELGRGQRASIYHGFAAQAIFGLALIHDANFSELNKGRFGNLVELLKKTAVDPGYIAEKAGVKQQRISKASWINVYERLVAGETNFLVRRGVKCPDMLRLGGDVCNFAALSLNTKPK